MFKWKEHGSLKYGLMETEDFIKHVKSMGWEQILEPNILGFLKIGQFNIVSEDLTKFYGATLNIINLEEVKTVELWCRDK